MMTLYLKIFFWQANPEEFIPVFANNPRELRAFLEHMIQVDPFSPEGVYDTLLELRLQDWAHEQDPGVKTCFIQFYTYLMLYYRYVIIEAICSSKDI